MMVLKNLAQTEVRAQACQIFIGISYSILEDQIMAQLDYQARLLSLEF
jgi:hypothetical protein